MPVERVHQRAQQSGESSHRYHSVEKKAAVTSDATVAIATQVAGSAISAFQAMLVFLLSIDPRRQVRRHLPPVADSESNSRHASVLIIAANLLLESATPTRVMDGLRDGEGSLSGSEVRPSGRMIAASKAKRRRRDKSPGAKRLGLRLASRSQADSATSGRANEVLGASSNPAIPTTTATAASAATSPYKSPFDPVLTPMDLRGDERISP